MLAQFLQGVLLVYHKAVQPLLRKHEEKIDKTLHEFHTRGADMAVQGARSVATNVADFVQKGAKSGQSLIGNQYQVLQKI